MNEWIKHDGKGMPVDGNTLVKVKFGDGTSFEKVFLAEYWHDPNDIESSSWFWADSNESAWCEIAEYKVV